MALALQKETERFRLFHCVRTKKEAQANQQVLSWASKPWAWI